MSKQNGILENLKKHPEMIKDIKKGARTLEICDICVSSILNFKNEGKMSYGEMETINIGRYIPKEVMTESLIIKLIQINDNNVRFIPKEKITLNVIKKLIAYPWFLSYISEEYLTEGLGMELLEKNVGIFPHYILNCRKKNKMDAISEKLKMYVIEKDSSLVKFFKEEDFSENILNKIITDHQDAIIYIPKSIMTKEMVETSIKFYSENFKASEIKDVYKWRTLLNSIPVAFYTEDNMLDWGNKYGNKLIQAVILYMDNIRIGRIKPLEKFYNNLKNIETLSKMLKKDNSTILLTL